MRAQWAGRPLLWHIYAQAENAHWDKLEAFLGLYLQGLSPLAQAALGDVWRAWNAGQGMAASWQALQLHWPEVAEHAERWAVQQAARRDLAAGAGAVLPKLAMIRGLEIRIPHPNPDISMKTAQEMKPNSVALIDGQPWLIQKAEFTKSGRNSAIVKMKLKNLLSGSSTETVYKADDKMEPVILDRAKVTYSYFSEPNYVFMDEEFNQYELNQDDLESVLPFIVDGMTDVCEAVFFEGKVVSVDLPTTIVRQITYTEGSARGDTSGKVMKPAKLSNGTEVKVADFCEIDDWIEIDTRTGEYKSRAKAPV